MSANTALEIGDSPDWLDAEAASKWSEVVGHLRGMGLVARSDSDALSLYCQTWSNWRNLQKSLAEYEPDAPEATRIGAAIHQANGTLHRLHDSFGLNPAARVRMGAQE